MNRGKGRNGQENNHSETREGKERETKGNMEKCGKIRRSAEKYDVRKRWKSAEMTLGKIIMKVMSRDESRGVRVRNSISPSGTEHVILLNGPCADLRYKTRRGDRQSTRKPPKHQTTGKLAHPPN